MKFQVVYSKIAIRDMDRVWSEVFEASKSYDVTRAYLDDLMNKIEAKADFPEPGSPLYYEDSFTGYYYVVFKSYMAFYRVDEGKLFVDRVLFRKSDYMRLFGW